MTTAMRGLMAGRRHLGQVGLALIAPAALTVLLAPTRISAMYRRQ